MIRKVLFDLDGVLVNTQNLNHAALNIVLERRGLPTLEEIDTIPTRLKLLRAGHDPQLVEELYMEKRDAFETAIDHLNPAPYLPRLLEVTDLLTQCNIDWGCVTNTNRPAACRLLRMTVGIPQILICGTDGLPTKPAPDMYVTAIQFMQTKPEECLVVEDSDTGVTAATLAGATVWKINDFNELTKENMVPWLLKL